MLPLNCRMIFRLCLRTSGSEAISRFVGPGPQWAVELKDYFEMNINYNIDLNSDTSWAIYV